MNKSSLKLKKEKVTRDIGITFVIIIIIMILSSIISPAISVLEGLLGLAWFILASPKEWQEYGNRYE